MIIHPFAPIIDSGSKILILGSFPSVQSRANQFYYGHRQNRFWKMLSGVFLEPVPDNTEGKKAYLLNHHIALWDVLESCEITGSADATIRNARINDIAGLVQKYKIKKVYFNGSAAYELFIKLNEHPFDSELIKMPSTSPANAVYDLNKLIKAWAAIKEM